MKKRKGHEVSRQFSKEVSITTWALVLVFAVLSSGATYYVLLNRVDNYMRNRVVHLTQEVARQSAYTLIAIDSSPDVAARFEASFVGVKDVRFAALINEKDVRVASMGEAVDLVDNAVLKNVDQVTVIRETGEDLHFLAPVFLKSDWEAPEKPRAFGYVYVVSTKETAHRLARNVCLVNIAFVVILGSGLLMWANKRTRRLTRPLEQLVATMDTLSTSDALTARAEVRGAVECRAAATAFNSLMDRLKTQQDQLREHAELLESKVLERTQELEQATVAAQAAARYKAEVMSSITHEMKAPLYIIGTYAREAVADLELVEVESDNIRKHLAYVIAEAEELSEKISQILQVARLDKGAYEIKREWIDVELICEPLFTRLALLSKVNRNEFEYSITGRTRVWGDPQMIEQILMTIGTNACKFTREGRIQLEVTTNDETLKIRMVDTGMGIPSHLLPSVFEEFRQGEMGEARGFAGTGLGLSIAKRYTELLEGRITIQSEVGSGTTVIVELPLKTPIAIVPTNPPAAAAY